MATIAEPNVVIDGLVFSLDAANSRCYSGTGLTANGLVGGIGGTLVNGVGFTSSNNGAGNSGQLFILDNSDDNISPRWHMTGIITGSKNTNNPLKLKSLVVATVNTPTVYSSYIYGKVYAKR